MEASSHIGDVGRYLRIVLRILAEITSCMACIAQDREGLHPLLVTAPVYRNIYLNYTVAGSWTE